MKNNLALQFEENAARQPQKTAFIYKEGRGPWKTITYQEILELARVFEAGLANLGIASGSRVILLAPPSIPFFALNIAILKRELSAVFIDPGIGFKNVSTCLAETGAEVFIGNTLTHALRILYGWGKTSVRLNLTVEQIFAAGTGIVPIPAEGATASLSLEADPEAGIIFTSGSTGLPKGAIYTQKNLRAQVELLFTALELDGTEIDLPAFPIYALIDLVMGVTAVIPNLNFPRPARVDPGSICEAIQTHQVATMFASPVMLGRVAKYAQEKAIQLSSLKKVFTAGAPAPVTVLENFKNISGPQTRIFGIYGATEALPITIIDCQEILEETRFATQAGSGICVGKAAGAEMLVRIISISDSALPIWEAALEVPSGTVGEIVVEGPAVSAAYIGSPEINRLAKIPPGLHRTGDLGWLDEQGRLWFCGRKSQRVETPEQTFFTEAVEGIFNAHPLVYRTALVGAKKGGLTRPVLWVELKAPANNKQAQTIQSELLELGAAHEMTRPIQAIVLIKGSFATDIRHNSKILRERLALAAQNIVK